MNERIVKLSTCLIDDAGDVNWDRIEYTLLGVSTFWQENAECYQDGRASDIDTTSERKKTAASPAYQAKQLRREMYNEAPEKGAWYTLKLVINSDGTFKIDVDYDTKPDFNIDIEEDRYAWDYEEYPRDATSTPAWLRTVLTKYGKS